MMATLRQTKYSSGSDLAKRANRCCDGLLLLTPEYNNSMPGVIKSDPARDYVLTSDLKP
jgi:NAD(P)H-dependent FMN reductase